MVPGELNLCPVVHDLLHGRDRVDRDLTVT
jgi:hypothetical protein